MIFISPAPPTTVKDLFRRTREHHRCIRCRRVKVPGHPLCVRCEDVMYRFGQRSPREWGEEAVLIWFLGIWGAIVAGVLFGEVLFG